MNLPTISMHMSRTTIIAAMVRTFLSLSILLFYVDSYAESKNAGKVNDILKLRLSPEEKVDSVFSFLFNYTGEVQDSLHYSDSEKIIRGQILPYAAQKQFDDSLMARIYDELGMMCNRLGPTRISDTRDAYEKGLDYARASDDYYREGRILEHLANAETRFGNQAEGFRLSEEAIKAYSKSGTAAEERITRCYYTQAVTYLNVMDLDGMRKVIRNLEDFSKNVSKDNLPFVLYNLYSVQEAYYGTLLNTDPKIDRKGVIDTLNRVSLATVRLVDDNYDSWKHTSINPTWNYYNRAVLLLEITDPVNVDSIEYYLDKAVSVDLSGKGAGRIEAMVSAASLRAEMWMKLGNYVKAKDILLDTIKMLDATEGINDLILDKVEIYKNLTEIAKQSGHYEEALDFASKVSALEKERFSEEKAKDIKELEIKYKTQETELALAQSEARRSNTLMWLFAAIGLLLIGLIAFLLYAGRERRRRMQKEFEFVSLRADINRQLTQQYVDGLETERKRMARELHDGVCNDLLAIRMSIKDGKAQDNTAALLETCRESVRRISHELMPPEFSYATLDEVMRFYVGKQAEAHRDKIEISYSASAEGREWMDIPDDMALEVYRIAQEAIGNAIKHSGSSVIKVGMNLDGDELTLRVADNGLFVVTRDKGFGLDSIRKRAESIGGSIRIDRHEDREANQDEPEGTTVSLKLKLEKVDKQS